MARCTRPLSPTGGVRVLGKLSGALGRTYVPGLLDAVGDAAIADVLDDGVVVL
jgi:hypothetical protein